MKKIANPVKMKFLVDDEYFRGVDAEWLWVIPNGDGTFTVDSVPFEIMGISAGDIVSGEVSDGAMQFAKVVHQSGNRTLRIKLNSVSIEDVRLALSIQSSDYEHSNKSKKPLYAINVPACRDYSELKMILDEMERRGEIEYEEANV